MQEGPSIVLEAIPAAWRGPSEAAQAAYRILRRLRDQRDRVLFPEAASGPEHWQRVAMNQAVDAYIAALDPLR